PDPSTVTVCVTTTLESMSRIVSSSDPVATSGFTGVNWISPPRARVAKSSSMLLRSTSIGIAGAGTPVTGTDTSGAGSTSVFSNLGSAVGTSHAAATMAVSSAAATAAPRGQRAPGGTVRALLTSSIIQPFPAGLSPNRPIIAGYS